MAPSERINRHRIKVAGRHFHLPASRRLRLVLGGAFLVGGLGGILPILGFWMLPVGMLILSIDIPAVRRGRRRLAVWWGRRRQRRAQDTAEAD